MRAAKGSDISSPQRPEGNRVTESSVSDRRAAAVIAAGRSIESGGIKSRDWSRYVSGYRSQMKKVRERECEREKEVGDRLRRSPSG
ncbi:hypothetical protein NL676_006639 [Syzygium grande]|nr:hypothetical protein NL676_006639 [Syzygium grande]